jgi:hypothetical protein
MQTSGPPTRQSPHLLSRRRTMIGASAGLSAVLLGLDGLTEAYSQARLCST